MTALFSQLLVGLSLASLASAQYNSPYYYGGGSSYGARIGIGVGIAALVLAIVLLGGFVMRRRRARAFKNNYPVAPSSAYTTGNNGGIPLQQQQPGYVSQQNYAPQQAPPCSSPPDPRFHVLTRLDGGYNTQPDLNYAQAPPQSNYQSPQGEYAPPLQPPPHAQTSSTPYYAPPSGPPPTDYNPANVQNK